jgi:hypothetical protein
MWFGATDAQITRLAALFGFTHAAPSFHAGRCADFF